MVCADAAAPDEATALRSPRGDGRRHHRFHAGVARRGARDPGRLRVRADLRADHPRRGRRAGDDHHAGVRRRRELARRRGRPRDRLALRAVTYVALRHSARITRPGRIGHALPACLRAARRSAGSAALEAALRAAERVRPEPWDTRVDGSARRRATAAGHRSRCPRPGTAGRRRVHRSAPHQDALVSRPQPSTQPVRRRRPGFPRSGRWPARVSHHARTARVRQGDGGRGSRGRAGRSAHGHTDDLHVGRHAICGGGGPGWSCHGSTCTRPLSRRATMRHRFQSRRPWSDGSRDRCRGRRREGPPRPRSTADSRRATGAATRRRHRRFERARHRQPHITDVAYPLARILFQAAT